MRRIKLFRCFAAAAIALCSACGGCDEGALHDIRCVPGDPALARNYDPAMPEICDGAADDNCNGVVDEGCDCVNTSTRSCTASGIYPHNAGVGACTIGVEICADGRWAGCAGAGSPSAEICDGLDNDCDGELDADDNDLLNTLPEECWDGSPDAVFAEWSACRKGATACVKGVMACSGSAGPRDREVCNGIDDDCNGLVDDRPVEEFEPGAMHRKTCGPDSVLGECRRGVLYCRGGELTCGDDPDGSGVEPVYPSQEQCDDKDNDCNGTVDDQIAPRACGNAFCPGMEFCTYGHWTSCTARTALPVELCSNFVDDDCDGQTDEECVCTPYSIQACFADVRGGPVPDCGRGTQTCQEDGAWSPCEFLDIVPELCNMGHDDDCDPATTDVDAEPLECGRTVGECRSGLRQCLASGLWSGVCDGEISPTEEICDNLDNDCDGEIDNDVLRRDAAALLFLVDTSGSMCLYTLNVARALDMYFAGFTSRTDVVCAVAAVPGNDTSTIPMRMVTDGFVPPAVCQQAIETLGCTGGGYELNLDVLAEATAPSKLVPWPDDKFPYIFWIGDEEHQTFDLRGLGPMLSLVEMQATTCLLPGCRPPSCQPPDCHPGPPELFVIEHPMYETSYAGMLNNTENPRDDRFCDITANDPFAYLSCLDGAFRDICR
jgi:hypothetical protein